MTNQAIVPFSARPLEPDAIIVNEATIRLIADGKGATPAHVPLVRDATMRYGIPLTGLNILGGKLYVNAAGLAYVAQHHPDPRRRVKSLTYTWIELPTKENGMVGGVKSRAELWDGSVFENEAWVDPETEQMSTMKTLSNARHKVITKALSRVLRWATGVAITAVEELGDQAEVKQVTGWQAPRAQVSDLFDVPDPARPAPALAQAAAIPPRDPAIDRARFWARAKELDYPNQRTVHEALGLSPERGALSTFMANTGLTWPQALARLEQVGRYREQDADPEALPLEPCPQCEGVAWAGGVCASCGYPAEASAEPPLFPEHDADDPPEDDGEQAGLPGMASRPYHDDARGRR